MPLPADGRYTVVYPGGAYRTLKLKTTKKGQYAGSIVVSYKDGKEWVGFGNLQSNGKIRFWNKWYMLGFPVNVDMSDARKTLIQKAVDRVLADPSGTGLAFALQEKRCYRCGKGLTVPASVCKGIGPECARKQVTREDNARVYNEVAPTRGIKPKPEFYPGNSPLHNRIPPTDSIRVPHAQTTPKPPADHPDVIEGNLFGQLEREQEAKQFMTDPDFQWLANPKPPVRRRH